MAFQGNRTGVSKRLLVGLVLAFAVMAFAALILFGTAAKQGETRLQEVRASAAADRVGTVLTHVVRAENARRGFVLEGSDRHWTYHTNALRDLETALTGLRVLAQDEPSLASDFAELDRLLAQWRLVCSSSLTSRKERGLDSTAQAAFLEEAQQVLAGIERITGRLTAREGTRMQTQQFVQHQDLQGALGVAFLIGLIGTLLFAALLLLLVRATRQRRKVEEALCQANFDLEARVTQRTVELQSASEEVQRMNAELEQRVRTRTAQLEEANGELEAFSYSVSHDLRAPLRHVQGYADMLHRATDGQLGEKAQRFLQTIRNASVEMGQLIDDLLAYSRIGRTEMQFRPVDLNALLQDVIRGLELATQDRHIRWEIGALPKATGDPAALRQVFANLVGNAVKYSRQRTPAEIAVGCAGDEGPHAVLFVRDNGAGFDMQYAHKLFGVFQRLHRVDEFEGSGVGLAIVRRVVARHGGRTWAEGVPGSGATFYFTLRRAATEEAPKNPTHEPIETHPAGG